MNALIVTDRALADVDALVAEAAQYLASRLGGTPPLDATALPHDAAAALQAIDAWAGTDVANWRQELIRWFEAHAPVRLVPDPEVNAALRRAAKDGRRMACASALPAPALELMLQQLGAARPFAAVVAGDGSLDDAISAAHAAVGRDAPVVASADALRAALAG